MAKRIIISMIFFSVAFTGCVAQNLSKAIDNTMGGRLFLNAAGNIYVKQSGDNSLLLLFRSEGTPVSSFDKAFIIFSETVIPKLSFEETDKFEIKIAESKKYATIYNVTRNKIYFIGTSDTRDIIDGIKNQPGLKQSASNSDYLGYGFSYMTAAWSVERIKESKYMTPFYTLDYANTQNTQLRLALPADDGGDGSGICAEGKCSSGGNGSSSCSIGEFPNISCSVTCNSGYYACCNSATTRCYCCKY